MTFWVAGAVVVGSAVSSNAASKASKTQANAANTATQEQARQFNVTQENYRPYLDAGKTSLNELQRLIGIGQGVDTGQMSMQDVTAENFDGARYLAANPDVAANPYFAANPYEHFARYGDLPGEMRQAMAPVYSKDPSTGFGSLQGAPTQAEVQLDPGYQFGLDEGQKAINRQTAAAGGRISGAALKSAARYGTDYATTKYDAAYNRTNQARADRLNRLAALAGVGQTSTQQVSQAGQNSANNIGNIQMSNANAQGAGQMAQANIWGNAGNQLTALYGRNAAPSGINYGTGSNQINTQTNMPNYATMGG